MGTSARRRAVLAMATAVVVAACGGLGAWQLARRADRRAYNARLLARSSMPVAALEGLPQPLRGGRDDPAAYRRVSAEGTFDADREVVLRARSHDGRAGNHVLTPLRMSSGRTVIVDRGWVPLDLAEAPVTAARPPPGRVAVTGILVPAEPPPRVFGPRDPPAGTLRSIGRVDLSRLGRQLPYPIEPLYLALESHVPARPGALPVAAGLPAPGEGSHLSYAVQWFVFAAIAAGTGVLLARRERRGARGTMTARDDQSGR